MAHQYEVAFIQHLAVPESLAEIVQLGLPDDLLPTEALRPIHLFAIDYWHSEATEDTAPTPEALRVHFEVQLAEHEIDLDIDPEDSLTWAVEALKGAWVDRHWQKWAKGFSSDMATADLLGKQEVLISAIGDLMAFQTDLSSKHEHIDVREAVGRTIELYESRVEMRASGQVDGMRTGFDDVDVHMFGIRPSELCVLAAPPKAGKSFFLLAAAYATWQNGGVPVVFSLENSIEMTMDRLACMVLNIDSRRWQRGEATDDEVERVRLWQGRMAEHERPIHIVQPPFGLRTIQHMTRQGRILGDSLFIDQLTFVEPEPGDERLPRYQQVGHSLHLLKTLLSSAPRLPCMLAHQINREGVKSAEKLGRLEMYHLAESAEVERTADWVLGLFQPPLLRQAGRSYLQSLAARREDLLDWEMVWRPWIGQMQVLGEVDLREAA